MRTFDRGGLGFQSRQRWWLRNGTRTESEVTAGDLVNTVVSEAGSESLQRCVYEIGGMSEWGQGQGDRDEPAGYASDILFSIFCDAARSPYVYSYFAQVSQIGLAWSPLN
jgi:hypothetical protein